MPSNGRERTAEAAAWLARLHADTRTARDERDFQAWLGSDPANASAFDAVTTIWDISGGVAAEYVGFTPSRQPIVDRRCLLAGIGALAAAGGTFAAWEAAFAGVYETRVGEQEHVALKDGSQLLLDTDTRLRVRFDERLRVVSLERGRVNIRVAADATRPFIVEAGNRRIVATHSTLDVRCDPEALSVVLIQGRALVQGQDATPAVSSGDTLEAGQRLVVQPARADKIDTPEMNRVVAWQTGQAVFDGQSLAEATAEMNRYSTVQLRISDPRTAALRVSGVYRVGDNVAFARSIALLLPVRVREDADHVEILAAYSATRHGDEVNAGALRPS
ncbi:MAG: FecR family protein [Caulobacteraceae bacterium]